MKRLGLAIGLLLLAGCTRGTPSATPCTTVADCGAGQACIDGRCRDGSGVDAATSRMDANVDANRPPVCPTTVSGVVRIPAGTLPVPGAVVYAASGPPDEIPTGVDPTTQCLRCDGELSSVLGTPVRTAVDGTFQLNVTPGDNVRVVVQIGKWRRQHVVPRVERCTDTQLDPEDTRLPRNSTEGHLPRIALTTGSCDGMECLLRKLGIDDSEFTTTAGNGRVNLFAETVCQTLPPPFPQVCESGRNRFGAAQNNEMFPDSSDWWMSGSNLNRYDAVLHSCECSETTENKPAPAMDALRQYADAGWRVFLTHYHYAWLKSSTDMGWRSIATWDGTGSLDAATGRIDTSFERGMLLADWMMLPEVGGSTTLGDIALREARQSLTSVRSNVQPWIRVNGIPAYFSFDTPFGSPDPEQFCGRVVFSDIHVSAADQAMSNPFAGGAPPFPGGCTQTLTPQEKALIFLLFDLTNCVGRPILF